MVGAGVGRMLLVAAVQNVVVLLLAVKCCRCHYRCLCHCCCNFVLPGVLFFGVVIVVLFLGLVSLSYRY